MLHDTTIYNPDLGHHCQKQLEQIEGSFDEEDSRERIDMDNEELEQKTLYKWSP